MSYGYSILWCWGWQWISKSNQEKGPFLGETEKWKVRLGKGVIGGKRARNSLTFCQNGCWATLRAKDLIVSTDEWVPKISINFLFWICVYIKLGEPFFVNAFLFFFPLKITILLSLVSRTSFCLAAHWLSTFSSSFSHSPLSPFSAAFRRTILIGTCYCFSQLLLRLSFVITVVSLRFESTNYLPNFHTSLVCKQQRRSVGTCGGQGAKIAAEDVQYLSSKTTTAATDVRGAVAAPWRRW